MIKSLYQKVSDPFRFGKYSKSKELELKPILDSNGENWSREYKIDKIDEDGDYILKIHPENMKAILLEDEC